MHTSIDPSMMKMDLVQRELPGEEKCPIMFQQLVRALKKIQAQ
jgi:hypothetical protein